jgi:hypothetical protein
MHTIYISDSGDDKNDGLSLKTAIYSLKRQGKSMAAGMILAGMSGREHGSGSKELQEPNRNRLDDLRRIVTD